MHYHPNNLRHASRVSVRSFALCLLASVVLTTPLNARKPGEESPQPPPPQLPNTPEIRSSIDSAHNNASEMIHDFASQIDNFFSDDTSDYVVNKTRATVRMEFSDPADDSFSATAKIKLRLVLPRSQQRIRLLLDVDDRDDESAETVTTDEAERDLSFAFRFIRNASEKTRFNVDLGARRFDQQFQAFARLRVSTKFINDEGWSFKLKNDLRQYHSSGYANRTGLDFWHSLNSDQTTLFRTSTNFNWEKIQNGARIDQSVGIYKHLRHNSLLAFELLAGYNTSPEEDESHYEGHTARIRFRKNVYRPWFHYEVWPSVSWLTENNRTAQLGGLLRFEVQLGNYR